MAKTVTCYKTADGQLFEDPVNAAHHEQKETLRSGLADILRKATSEQPLEDSVLRALVNGVADSVDLTGELLKLSGVLIKARDAISKPAPARNRNRNRGNTNPSPGNPSVPTPQAPEAPAGSATPPPAKTSKPAADPPAPVVKETEKPAPTPAKSATPPPPTPAPLPPPPAPGPPPAGVATEATLKSLDEMAAPAPLVPPPADLVDNLPAEAE